MFLLLESQDVLAMEKVIALVRDDDGTVIHMQDGTAMRSVFRPDTLKRRCFPKRADEASRKEGE